MSPVMLGGEWKTYNDRNRSSHSFVKVAQREVNPFPEKHWDVYRRVIDGARQRGIPFAFGGAIGIAAYTGQWRYTKDLDFYITPDSFDAMVQVLTDCGLQDYYEKSPYDRGWIYRAYADDVIVDAIFGMPNRRAQVDLAWLTHGPELVMHGEVVRVVPPEEMVWAKMYVVQRERTDWPDILNLLYAVGPELDWEHLQERVGSDRPVLSAILSLFRWIAPARARSLPTWLWRYVELPPPEAQSSGETMRERAYLLDTRPWFLPTLDEKGD